MLSSHPLPLAALAGTALRRIFEETPPTPRVALKKQRRQAETGAPSSREPRAVAGRYRLESYLESGGTADVYCALDLATGRRVAIKLLRQDTAQNAVLREHFMLGARAAQRIEHENVVRVLEVHERRGLRPYAVMELLEGRSLDAVPAKGSGLAPALVLEIARQIAAGLSAAHKAGVVHCDVKPENLFIAGEPGGTARIKVLDFDLANVDGAEDPGEAHVLRGTAKYMAPEQVVGDPVDGRTDVYALGVVLFRLLTGQLPFDLPLGATLLRHQLYSPLPPVSWLVESVDPRLEALITRATRKDPFLRYPSMQALHADLDALIAGEPLSEWALRAEPDSYRPRTPRGIDNEMALRPEAWPIETSAV